MSSNNGVVARPWDHHRPRPPPSKKPRQQVDAASMAQQRQEQQQQREEEEAAATTAVPVSTAVPYITIQGINYYSDRFYLNKTIHDNDNVVDNNNTGCTCGAITCNAPPLLDRRQLVESLNLKAVIMATYTINPSWLIQHEFPTLLGKDSTVPTLVLHGQKGWNPTKYKEKKQRHHHDDDDTLYDHSMDNEDDFMAEEEEEEDCHVDLSNMPQQEQMQQDETESNNKNNGSDNDDDDSDNDDDISWGTQPEETCCPRVSKKSSMQVNVMGNTTTTASSAVAAVAPPLSSIAVAAGSPVVSTFPLPTSAVSKVAVVAAAATTATNNHKNHTAPCSSSSEKKKHQHYKKHKQQQQSPILTCPSHVHWSEVLPCWMPLQELPYIQQQENINDSSSAFSVSQAVVDKRKCKRGVHHPKYMILFEQSGSIVVFVSTANLTQQRTTDASWMQRFYPMNKNENANNNSATSSSSSTSNDFGMTLAHFLQCQNWATKQGDWTPAAFCQKYLGFDNNIPQQQQQDQTSSSSSYYSNAFRNLYKDYDFSTAQVHLVSHVPGDYPAATMPFSSSSPTGNQNNHNTTNMSGASTSTTTATTDTSFNPSCFGRMRVAEILERLSPSVQGGNSNCGSAGHHHSNWLNKCIVSSDDQLILQPTSFGADWTPSNMADVVQSYLQSSLSPFQNPNHDDADDDKQQEITPSVSDWLKRVDIVWPTDEFMQDVSENLKANSRRPNDDDGEEEDMDRISPTSAMTMRFAPRVRKARSTAGSHDNNDEGDNDRDDDDDDGNPIMVGNGTRDNSGFIFLSSATFNKIHIDCLSRMVMFEATKNPPQRHATLAPHFKSIARHYRGKTQRLKMDYAVGEYKSLFSWFLLTSACLSLGAQGERRSTSSKKSSSTTASVSGDTISFSNFELGVLFCSRLQGRPQSDRLYCWRPDECTFAQGGKMETSSKLIHLPVPFSISLDPNRYLENPEVDMHFCKTPYFNEIPPGTAGVGNMMYTPYGKNVADSLHRND